MSKLRAGASSFAFNPSSSSFTPSGWTPQPKAEPEKKAAPILAGGGGFLDLSGEPAPAAAPKPTPEPAPEPAPEASEDWEQQGGEDELDEDNMTPEQLAAYLEANPELAAEYAEIKQQEEREAKEKAERKAAALARREAKKAAQAAEDAANRVTVDEREHLNIVFIGHVDAGKSTISGQIMLATGQIDERTIARYKQEAVEKGRDSWYLAFILDSNDEEKAKGKTVEVGRAQFTTNTKRYTLLDAPGHKNYVPNMIGGAQQADVGVLVISARRGEFETGFDRGGQTREHAMLAKTLGIKRLVVLVNKMDEKTVMWNKERYDQIEAKLSPFLKRSGFNLKTEVKFCPISGYQGANIATRYNDCDWYNGPCFLEILDQLPPLTRDTSAPMRIPVITRFKDMGSLMILGKMESGTLRKGDKLVLMPGRKECTCKSIIVDELDVDEAEAGENVLVKVSGIEESDVGDGMVLCEAKRCAERTILFDAQIQVLDLLEHKPILTSGYQAVLHIHSLTVECAVVKLIEEVKLEKKKKKVKKKKAAAADGEGKKKGKKKGKKGTIAAPEASKAAPTPVAKSAKPPAPKLLRTGAVAMVRIRTRGLVCIETFEDLPSLGRFSLRDQGVTIAIGKVTKIAKPRSRT